MVNDSGDTYLRALSVGGTLDNTVANVEVDTDYYVWATYKKGSGGNAISTVAFNTTFTRPTSGDNFAECTDGTATADMIRLYLGGDNYNSGYPTGSYTCKLDQVMTWED